ncbi:BTAD domain-containing putative transcriptional regulator [Longispora sp. NPDC051575]|uniref:BTAD domain-containing putative transcriptional regulator n=1 Tax=Longispora sp. NPDC051575 TaxID=3154943 RepID=UPI00343CD1C0
MEIRLLGPLELTVGDRVVPLGGARRGALLGLLALRLPAVVSVSQLVDDLWCERPPPAAVSSLRAHVSRLRGVLDDAGLPGLIATRPPGYALCAEPGAVDASRFHALSVQGRAALDAGRVDEAARCLRAALELWRGEVLAGYVLGEDARAEIVRLAEERLYTSESLYAAELGRGQHGWVAAELETMVARYPLRERLWELLMTAYLRGGRQGDALAGYRRAREALVAALGVEPGPGLRRLEAAILRGDEHVGDPAAPVARRATVLPVPITALVGRQEEAAEVGKLLTHHRLVTLTGVGGSGKTRLAIEIAHRAGPEVGFVDLSAVRDPLLLPETVGTALGLPEHPGARPDELLSRYLGPLRLLLVLDNCEHLAGACAALVVRLLGTCPGLRILVTSTGTLGVLGEVAWPVPPLSVPPPDAAAGGLTEVGGYDAVRLFLDRASVPGVRSLRDADAAALITVCAGLDGLPLAIELAAARTTVLTVGEIAGRLNDPGLLRGSGPGHRAHHGALRQAMAWSYGLLDPGSRSRFRRLAVFHGGFALGAVGAVWPESPGQAVDHLSELVAKSLVVAEHRPGEVRYRLLETLRRYAAEQLGAVPDELTRARADHAEHYQRLAATTDPDLRGPDLDRLLGLLAVEHDNLRAALAWHAAHRPGEPELGFATDLARYCHLRGRYREGRRWLEEALGRVGGMPASPALARALNRVARLAFFECDYAAATAHGERALATHRELADVPGAAAALGLLGSIARERGHYDVSLSWHRRSAEAYRSAGDPGGEATALQLAGFTHWLGGDLSEAERLLDRALGRFRQLEDPEGVASCRLHLAAVSHYRGDQVRARSLAERALAGFGDLGFDEGRAWASNILGLVEQAEGAPAAAITRLRLSLELHCGIGDRWRAASVAEALAASLAGGPDTVAAAELFGAANAIRAVLGTPVPPRERPARDATAAALRAALPDRERYAALDRGEELLLADLPGLVP